jgi:hypothetical protein
MNEIPQYFAQVTDGVVTNIAVVQREFLEANPDRYQGEWIDCTEDGEMIAGIGSIWNGTDFVSPVITEA